MSNRLEAQARVIHPRALKELGEEACIVALGVARDLRSGVIPREKFDMEEWCGTACCIAGHITVRMGVSHPSLMQSTSYFGSDALMELFGGWNPSDPILAADAIERYVYDGADEPWKVPAMTGG